jgi:hypothetical protein
MSLTVQYLLSAPQVHMHIDLPRLPSLVYARTTLLTQRLIYDKIIRHKVFGRYDHELWKPIEICYNTLIQPLEKVTKEVYL